MTARPSTILIIITTRWRSTVAFGLTLFIVPPVCLSDRDITFFPTIREPLPRNSLPGSLSKRAKRVLGFNLLIPAGSRLSSHPSPIPASAQHEARRHGLCSARLYPWVRTDRSLVTVWQATTSRRASVFHRDDILMITGNETGNERWDSDLKSLRLKPIGDEYKVIQ